LPLTPPPASHLNLYVVPLSPQAATYSFASNFCTSVRGLLHTLPSIFYSSFNRPYFKYSLMKSLIPCSISPSGSEYSFLASAITSSSVLGSWNNFHRKLQVSFSDITLFSNIPALPTGTSTASPATSRNRKSGFALNILTSPSFVPSGRYS